METNFNDDYLDEKAEFIHALANPIRLKILEIIGNEKVCVNDISKILQIRQPNISQHLNILRNAGILKKKREGKTICYTIIKSGVRNLLKDIDNILNSKE